MIGHGDCRAKEDVLVSRTYLQEWSEHDVPRFEALLKRPVLASKHASQNLYPVLDGTLSKPCACVVGGKAFDLE